MAEYIERDELLKDIEEERPENWTDSESERQAENDFYKYRDIVKMQTAADVVEVKHGEWIEYQTPNIICCSECDWGTGVDEKIFNYCPNCGAKMDLKEGADQ